jgi:hypothetical protein
VAITNVGTGLTTYPGEGLAAYLGEATSLLTEGTGVPNPEPASLPLLGAGLSSGFDGSLVHTVDTHDRSSPRGDHVEENPKTVAFCVVDTSQGHPCSRGTRMGGSRCLVASSPQDEDAQAQKADEDQVNADQIVQDSWKKENQDTK